MLNQNFKIVTIFIMIGLIFPIFSFAQEEFAVSAPQTVDEAKNLALSILTKLPDAVRKVWQEEAIPVLQNIWEWIRPLLEPLRQKLMNLLSGEVEKRRPEIEQQLKEEKEEIQKDLWERFKNILKSAPAPTPAPTPTLSPTFMLVRPYLIYPADKPMYPAYETAVKNYLKELQNWYLSKVGKTFKMADLQVLRSSRSYLNMRCGDNPNQTCINDPSKFEGNWAQYMNEAVHGGTAAYYNGGPGWSKDTADFVFSAGGGGYAGSNSNGTNSGWGVTGDWVLEPISGIANSWGIPCSYSSGWQCSGGVPKGSPAHELGHAFGLPHPGAQYASQSIMEWHGNYPTIGFIQQEIDFLLNSPFFK